MGLNRIFGNRFGHLRAGWRILIWLGMVLLCFAPVAGSLKLWDVLTPANNKVGNFESFNSLVSIVFYLGLNVAIIIGSWLVLSRIDRRPYALLGLDFKRHALKDYGHGFLLGIANFMVIFLILLAAGHVNIRMAPLNPLLIKSLLSYFIAFNCAAMFEELLNRGYPFQAFMEGTRPWIATVVVSLTFVGGHASNPGFAWNNAVFFFIHSVLYCILYLMTRSIWVPIGFHFSWNWIQGSILGLTVSGMEVQDSLFICQTEGPVLLTGGEFGIEGSLISTVISIILIILLLRSKWLKPDAIRSELWKKYPGGFGLEQECNQK